MDLQDDDRPLGVPVMKPRPKADATTPTAPAPIRQPPSQPMDAGRHPADELGLPRQMPLKMHVPTKDELAAIQVGEELEAKRAYAEAIQSTLGRFNNWGRLLDKTLLVVVLAVLALLALFAFSQALQILAALAVQPLPLKVFGYALLTAIFVTLVVFSWRLLLLLRRLRVNQQISAAQLRELSRRAELRAMVQRDKAAAKSNLEAYLRSYPLPEGPAERALGFQADDATIKKLRDAREFLLDHERFSDYDGWLSDFQLRFQDTLQGTASSIVGNWMKLVGIKTAISPNPMIDSVIVLYCSYGMIGDLCRLYNLRMTRPGMIRLLALSLFNTYAAVQLEDNLDTLSGAVSDNLFDFADLHTFGLSDVAGKFLPKLADGTANALLLRKLGKSTITMLRPLDPQ